MAAQAVKILVKVAVAVTLTGAGTKLGEKALEELKEMFKSR